jgi:hypothetical protein
MPFRRELSLEARFFESYRISTHKTLFLHQNLSFNPKCLSILFRLLISAFFTNLLFLNKLADAQCYYMLVPQPDDPPPPPTICIQCQPPDDDPPPCQPIFFGQPNCCCNCCQPPDDDDDDNKCILLRIITRAKRYAIRTKELAVFEKEVVHHK